MLFILSIDCSSETHLEQHSKVLGFKYKECPRQFIGTNRNQMVFIEYGNPKLVIILVCE